MDLLNNTTTLTGINIEPTTMTISYEEVLSTLGDQIMGVVLLAGIVFTLQSILFFFSERRFCRDLNEFISGMGLALGIYLLALGVIWKLGLNV